MILLLSGWLVTLVLGLCLSIALVFVKDTEKVYKVAFYKSWNCALSSVIPVADSFAAVGSGSPYALAAMECGYSAHGGVAVASKFDTNTGGKIITKQLLG